MEEILKHVAVKVAEQRDSDVEELLKERAVEAWKSREEGLRFQHWESVESAACCSRCFSSSTELTTEFRKT